MGSAQNTRSVTHITHRSQLVVGLGLVSLVSLVAVLVLSRITREVTVLRAADEMLPAIERLSPAERSARAALECRIVTRMRGRDLAPASRRRQEHEIAIREALLLRLQIPCKTPAPLQNARRDTADLASRWHITH